MKEAYINNQPYPIKEGETMLSFIKRHKGDKYVPTLCDTPNLDPFGSCRVCSVDVALEEDGIAKTMASCHSPIAEGQYIYPDSTEIKDLRKNIIELVLTDHPLDCLTCEVNGNCELQDVAAQVGIREVRYPEGDNHLEREKDLSHPYMTSDMSKCINCYRCVRACDEVQGEFVLSMSGRGFDSKIIKGIDQSFMESDCVSCGACSQACPTSAISDVFQSKAIEATETIRTICTYCGVGCNLDISTNNGEILSIQAPYDAEVNQGHTCLKGRYAFKFYDHPERLNSPMIKRDGVFEKVSWDEVYDYIAGKLKGYKEEYGADSIAGISSSRCTNEENYLMQKFMRAAVGTNNIDGCARVCHSPTALGMQRTFGTGAATNSIDDLKDTSCILVIGANPTDAHPVTGAKLKQFAMKTGNVSIVLDPRRTEIARYATHHIALRPGTNVAVLNMMMYYIIKEGLADDNFIDNRTEGFEDYKKELFNIDLNKLEKISGVNREEIRQAAIAYASAPNAMSFHGLGVTEHSQGTFTVMQIADLALMTGNIGRRGVGVNPLRGQNNVQGSADMGVQPHQGAGYLDITNPEVNARYNTFYGVDVPSHIGYKIPEMFDAALEGKLKAIWIIGEDVVQTDPNTQKVIKALNNTDLVIVQELFMTETALQADVILPGASFLEKSGTFTNGERRVQAVRQVVEPIEGAKVDGQILVDIMNRMGYAQPDYEAATMLDEINQIVPFFAGITWDRLGNNGLQWPVALDGTDTQILHQTEFKIGKGQFIFNNWRETEELVSHAKDYPYILTTNRELEHYNCGAMTRRTGNVEILKDDYLMINPEDATKHFISEGDYVCLESPRGKVDVKAKITNQVKSGVVSTTFHFPEIMINNITGDVHDSEAMCPEYKVVAVKIRKSKGKFKQLAEV
ncbi:formate dehydrogenase subunit alpha [Saprospiraceae bacterium]|nr:formate dehydrogenase subunit alpha [Saprospiraceae bacterium]MDA9263879.1 formate dehydrogenase subunit alpha [Saprospiraceae bacterium]MDB4824177.1 formate dehydrogenase subunit alpha [Saprospiraceae bacterium]MDC1308743.1 formate dehydrogenase subunit alpha [Saprospiraceae bacterium]